MNKLDYSELYYNVVVAVVFTVFVCVFIIGLGSMYGPLSKLNQNISLNPQFLPEYLLRTGMRFLIAMSFSVVVAIIYGVISAKNLRMRRFLIPLLDIFQSIPVLGYLSFTVTVFVNWTPNNILGVELAVIFAIFTAQVWNMIFSVYQSFITIPNSLYEVARIFKLNKWQIFWRIELPFAIPGLIWNIILSMSASWFYIVAQEVITVGTQSYTMPGMGAYIALALKHMDIHAMIYAAMAMTSLIFAFSEFFFKPLVAWGYKFRYEFSIGSDTKHESWFLHYLQRASICRIITMPMRKLFDFIVNLKFSSMINKNMPLISKGFELIFGGLVLWALIIVYQQLSTLCANHVVLGDVIYTFKLGLITAVRVIVTLMLASFIWIPVGIFIGLRPKISNMIQPAIQLLTALPANFYYPLFVITIVHFKLNADIWLSFMIVIGSQWYILYNVIGGTQTIPTDLLEAGTIFNLSSFRKCFKIILPAILPFYITGLITASGASWNASIIAEIITWGNITLTASGLGTYIAANTTAGDFAHIALGIIVMCIFVVSINHILWKPLYIFASTRFRLE